MVALGILLDTFIVRTIMVPAAVELIGDKIWWPSTATGGVVLHEDTAKYRLSRRRGRSGIGRPRAVAEKRPPSLLLRSSSPPSPIRTSWPSGGGRGDSPS